MNNKGFLPLNRRVFEHQFWCEDREYSRFEAWIDLIQMARFEDTEGKKMIRGRLMKWKRGQLPASIGFLSSRWKWTDKRVRTYLALLESEKMITKDIAKGNPTTTITICNYDHYNSLIEPKGQSKGQSEGKARAGQGQQTNKENKENKDNITSNEVVDLWNSVCIDLPRVENLTDNRKRKINTRLKEMAKTSSGARQTLHELFSKVQSSSFLKGEDKDGWKANFDWVFTNSDNWIKVIEGNYDNRTTPTKNQKEDDKPASQKWRI